MVTCSVYGLESDGGTSERTWKPGRRIPDVDEKDLTVTSRIPLGWCVKSQ